MFPNDLASTGVLVEKLLTWDIRERSLLFMDFVFAIPDEKERLKVLATIEGYSALGFPSCFLELKDRLEFLGSWTMFLTKMKEAMMHITENKDMHGILEHKRVCKSGGKTQ